MDLQVAVVVFVVLVAFAAWIALLVRIVDAWKLGVNGWRVASLFVLVFAAPVAVGVGLAAGSVPR